MIPVNRCCLSSLYLICSQSSPMITNDTDHCTPCMWRGPGPGPDWAVQVPGVVWASARCVPPIRRLHRTRQCWAPQPSHEVPWLLWGTVACLLWLLLLTYPVIQRFRCHLYLLYSLLLCLISAGGTSYHYRGILFDIGAVAVPKTHVS